MCLALTLCGCGGSTSQGTDPVSAAPAPIATPAPAPSPSPTQTPAPVSRCPAGTADVGTIGGMADCRLPQAIVGALSLQKLPDVIYSIDGPTTVGTDTAAGEKIRTSLTLGAGVVVYAATRSTFLIVLSGSSINVYGTVSAPVILTSAENVRGTATDDSAGQWGGLVILSSGVVTNCDNGGTPGTAACTRHIDGLGVPAIYGGTIGGPAGSLYNLQIRFAGFSPPGSNERLGGLTLAGVYKQGGITYTAAYNNVQVHNSAGTGIAFLGGGVTLDHVAVSGAGGDSFTSEYSYSGALDNVVAVQRPGVGGSMLLSGPSDAASYDRRYDTKPGFSNFTFVQQSATASAIILRGGAGGRFQNGVVVNRLANSSCLDVDDPVDAAGGQNRPVSIGYTLLGCARFDDPDGDVLESAYASNAPAHVRTQYMPTLMDVYVNGPTERSAAATSPGFVTAGTPVSVGAVPSAADRTFAGWTCSAGYFPVTGSSACTSLPR